MLNKKTKTKINKPNNVGNIASLKKEDDVVLVDKQNTKNVLTSFYFTDYTNSKAMRSFIQKIKSQIRSSNEYKDYIGHLNYIIGINSCQVFGNITDSDEVTLEYHHYPFTIDNIIEICINRRIQQKEQFCSMDIIEEVLNLHKLNKIGLVKLCKTAHQLVHDGKIFIKLESVFGKVQEFIEEYEDAIPDEMIDKYNQLIEMNDIDFNEYIIGLIEQNPEIKDELMEENQKLIEFNNPNDD